MPTKRAQAQCALGCMLQQMPRHRGVRSRRRGRRCRRCSDAGGNTLYLRTQTHRTKRQGTRTTRGTALLRAMRAACKPTPTWHPDSRPQPALQRSGWDARASGLMMALRVANAHARSGLMLVVRPPASALLPTTPIAAPAGRAPTSTALTFSPLLLWQLWQKPTPSLVNSCKTLPSVSRLLPCFWFLVCYAATQLATPLHQRRIQMVRSNKVARKRLTESNGTPAVDFGCKETRKRRYTKTKNRAKNTNKIVI